MSKLTIYINPVGNMRVHYTGFSWLAFLSLFLWMIHRRIHIAFIVLSIPVIVLLNIFANWQINQFSYEPTRVVLSLSFSIGWSVIVGKVANEIHRIYLLRSNYQILATECSEDTTL